MVPAEKLEPYYRVMDTVRNWLIVLIFAFIVISGAVQIFLRYTPGLRGFQWTTEVLRYLNIWVVFIGASVAIKANAHLQVDYFVEKFASERARRIIRRFTMIAILGVLVLLIVIGTQKVFSSMNVVIQAAPISVSVFYLAVPVGCLLMLIDYSLIFLYGEHPFRPDKTEQT